MFFPNTDEPKIKTDKVPSLLPPPNVMLSKPLHRGGAESAETAAEKKTRECLKLVWVLAC